MTGTIVESLSRVLVVARRELVTRGRSTAFRATTALLLLGTVAAILVPATLTGVGQTYTVAVTGAGRAALAEALRGTATASGLQVDVRPAADRAAAVRQVQQGSASAALVGTGEIVWKGQENRTLEPVLHAAVTQVTVTSRAAALGVPPDRLAVLLAPVSPRTTRLDAGREGGPQFFIALIGMVVLFLALNVYGGYVLTGVVEEKSNRVVEVLLARVRPTELLAGKVLGIGLLGLGQLVALAVAAVVTLQVTQLRDVPATTPWTIVGVLLWFTLGFAFYSVLYGAVGSLASRVEDAQTALMPLTGLMFLVYFGAFFGAGDPEAWWVTLASFLPPTAPIFMPLRAGLLVVPAWQVALAVALTLAGIYGLVQVGGRVYRGAVLRTGGRVRARDAWRAEQHA